MRHDHDSRGHRPWRVPFFFAQVRSVDAKLNECHTNAGIV